MTPIIDRRRAALDARERDRAVRRLARRLADLTHRPGDHRQWKSWSEPELDEVEALDDAHSWLDARSAEAKARYEEWLAGGGRGPRPPRQPAPHSDPPRRESDPTVMLSFVLVSGAFALVAFLAGFLLGRLT